MPEPLLILTGEKQSGKTSKLLTWTNSRENMFGILTPVTGGSRVFWNVHSRESFAMEALENEDALEVGKYHFSKSGFEKAIQVIVSSLHNPGWLVVDEIGPLELRGEGFSSVVKRILEERKGKTLFVVRKNLVGDVVNYFEFDRWQVKIIDVDGALPV